MRKLERKCAWVAVATIAVMVFMMAAACAAPIGSKMTTEQKGDRGQALARAATALDTAGITAKLKAYGLSDEQVNQRLSQLSTDELQQITSGAEAVAAGGSESTPSTTTWLIIIVIVLLIVSN